MKAFRNINLCLVHEQQDCVVDLIHNLRVQDPDSAILLYDGSGSANLLTGFPFDRFDVTAVPNPRAMRWGRLHGFALESMSFALEHFSFDSLTIVDSDQLAIRKDYSRYLGGFLRDGERVGMFVSEPAIQTRATAVGPAQAAWDEYATWEPLLHYFGADERDFVRWTFWPATVFTRHAVEELVGLVSSNTPVRETLEHTRIWATEEVIFPTLVSLLGFELRSHPSNQDFVRHGTPFSIGDALSAFDTPDAFWMHPVLRAYDDPVRGLIRHRSQRGVVHPETSLRVSHAPFQAVSTVDAIEGWLTIPEVTLLMSAATQLLDNPALPADFVEVGSFKGRSTVALASVLKHSRAPGHVYAIDPHEGYVGAADSGIHALGSTFDAFIHNLEASGMRSAVAPILGTTSTLAWSTPVSLVFIDGLHDYVNVARDALTLAPALVAGGLMVFHDYADEYPGVTTFVGELANSGRFDVVARTGSLIVLQKTSPPPDESAPALEADGPRVGGGRRHAPRVSCIMPTGYRREWALRALRYFSRQDYGARELIVIDEGDDDLHAAAGDCASVRYLKVDPGLSVGAKRNIACEMASGDVILHWDDDDWSAEWRITYQLEQLLATGASVSGLSNLICCAPATESGWQYRYPRDSRPWVAGGTLCYYKDVWRRTPFECITEGEDTAFVWSVDENDVAACDVNTFYIASIHHLNTSVKETDGPYWERYSMSRIRSLLSADARDYGL